MKHLLYVVLSLIVIAAITPQAMAATTYNTNLTEGTFSITNPYTFTVISGTEDYDQACHFAYGPSYHAVETSSKVIEYNSVFGVLKTSYPAFGSSYTSTNNPYYIAEHGYCNNANYVVVIKIMEQGTMYPLNKLVFNTTAGNAPLSVKATATNDYSQSDYIVTWGDGTTTREVMIPPGGTTGILSHVYTEQGVYYISARNDAFVGNIRTISNSTPIIVGDPLGDFNGTPRSGPAPITVQFNVVNMTSPTGMSWNFGDGNVTSTSITTISHFYQNPGTYTVRLDYTNTTGYPLSIQKNNYIIVNASNATKTKYFQTIDGTNGNIVLNSSIQLKDVENTSWVNATGLTADGMSSITTLVGHHINAYAQALGYSDADDLNILNDGTPRYIMMWPTFAKNVSAGNVSLYVTVKDKDTMANIKGAGVTISPQSGSAQSTFTNDAGIAYFVVKNQTLVYVTAQANGQGYTTGVTTINTGSGSGGSASAATTILLSKNLVTPVFSTIVTTLPGGGTPTPTTTILPGCEDTVSAEGQAKCRAAQSNQGLSFLSANMRDLIMICVFVTMLYLLGIKLGR